MEYYIKLSDYAKKFGIVYRTAWNRYKRGQFPDAIIDETGHICIPMSHFVKDEDVKVAVYARVSSTENKSNLETLMGDETIDGSLAKQIANAIGSKDKLS